MDDLENNPFLQQENYNEGYNASIENFKNRPDIVAFDRLTFEVFETEQGKKWMEMVMEKYVIPPMADRNGKDFPTQAVWGEGFKDFPRMIRLMILSHQQRIKAETNKI